MYWQWMALGILVFLGFFIDLIFRLFFRSFLRRWMHKALSHITEEPEEEVLRRAVRACGMLVATIIWRIGIDVLFLPMEVLEILLVATNIMLVLAAIFAGFKLTDFLGGIFIHRAKHTDNKLDDLIVPLITKSLKIVVVIIGFIYFAQAIDVKISPLLAGLGIGGIGFAFAAQNSIENFFGSITVLLDRPFQVGDWVVIDNVEGTVIAVGMRSLQGQDLLRFGGDASNSILVNNQVNNYGMRAYRRWTTKLDLLYETTPEQVEAYCEGARQLVREHPYMRKDYYQGVPGPNSGRVASRSWCTSSGRPPTGRRNFANDTGSCWTSCDSRRNWTSPSRIRPRRCISPGLQGFRRCKRGSHRDRTSSTTRSTAGKQRER